MPQNSLMGMRNQMGSSPATPNQSYNSVSSMGVSDQENLTEQSQEPKEENPAEQAIADFKQTFDSVQTLMSKPEYQFASKEADLVTRAFQNWLETVVTALSRPQEQVPLQRAQAGESPQNNLAGATPA